MLSYRTLSLTANTTQTQLKSDNGFSWVGCIQAKGNLTITFPDQNRSLPLVKGLAVALEAYNKEGRYNIVSNVDDTVILVFADTRNDLPIDMGNGIDPILGGSPQKVMGVAPVGTVYVTLSTGLNNPIIMGALDGSSTLTMARKLDTWNLGAAAFNVWSTPTLTAAVASTGDMLSAKLLCLDLKDVTAGSVEVAAYYTNGTAGTRVVLGTVTYDSPPGVFDVHGFNTYELLPSADYAGDGSSILSLAKG